MIVKTEEVKVVQIPGFGTKTVTLEGDDRSIAAVLSSAGVDARGYEARLNNNPAKPEDPVKQGDVILLLQKVQGNQ